MPFVSTWKTDYAGVSNSDQITIPAHLYGSYDCIVDWGDGTQDTITTYDDPAWTHTYPSIGSYTVTITGVFTNIRFNTGGDRLKITEISEWGGYVQGNTTGGFAGCENLNISATDALVVQGAGGFGLFDTCTSLVDVYAENWDLSACNNLTQTFINCSSLQRVFLASWDVRGVLSFNAMFRGCASLVFVDMSNWVTTSATSIRYMFRGCTSVVSINMINFDFTNITDTLGFIEDTDSLISIAEPVAPVDTTNTPTSGSAGDTIVTGISNKTHNIATVNLDDGAGNSSDAVISDQGADSVSWTVPALPDGSYEVAITDTAGNTTHTQIYIGIPGTPPGIRRQRLRQLYMES
jgi:hypothetical protein